MWAPRLWTRAPTVLKAEAEQVRLPHTLNARRLPRAGGPAATTSGVSATLGPAGGVAIANGAVGCSVTACRRKGDDAPGELLADCGTSRYSAESTAEALATTVTHPASDAGSIDVYAPTASTT